MQNVYRDAAYRLRLDANSGSADAMLWLALLKLAELEAANPTPWQYRDPLRELLHRLRNCGCPALYSLKRRFFPREDQA